MKAFAASLKRDDRQSEDREADKSFLIVKHLLPLVAFEYCKAGPREVAIRESRTVNVWTHDQTSGAVSRSGIREASNARCGYKIMSHPANRLARIQSFVQHRVTARFKDDFA